MNWHSLEVWSDLVGLASAALMVVPAWQADSMAAFVDDLRAVLKPPHADPNAAAVLADIERVAAAWKPSGRWLLRLGIALLGASFLLKMGHHAGLAF